MDGNILIDRRQFISGLLMAGAWTAGIPGLIQKAFAMGAGEYPQGIREMSGEVRINGQVAKIGDIIQIGDVITTGEPQSHAIFVVGLDAFLLRDKTRVEVSSQAAENVKDRLADVIRITTGKMLAVFQKGSRTITTPTAVTGVRGTGAYFEAEPTQTYICTCYGTFDIQSVANPSVVKTFEAKHHEYPQMIYGDGRPDQLIIPGPMKNHTDAELKMLESLVGRTPPFVYKASTYRSGDDPDDQGKGGDGGGGGGY